MSEKYDRLFRYKNGSFCQEYYPGAIVTYSRGLRALTIEALQDPEFQGSHDQMVKHILYMSVSNGKTSDDGTFRHFTVSLGCGGKYIRQLRASFTRSEDGSLELVMLMLVEEAGNKGV